MGLSEILRPTLTLVSLMGTSVSFFWRRMFREPAPWIGPNQGVFNNAVAVELKDELRNWGIYGILEFVSSCLVATILFKLLLVTV